MELSSDSWRGGPEAAGLIGRRWRRLFLGEAVQDQDALDIASRGGRLLRDKRPERQRIAERYLIGEAVTEWADEPDPRPAPRRQAHSTDVTLIYCPGMLNGMMPMRAFEPELQTLSHRTGMRVMRADLHPMDSSEANLADLTATMELGAGLDAGGRLIPEHRRTPPGDVVLLGYSKGMPDILTLLVQRPDLARRVRAVISWAGANMGSSLVDELHRMANKLELDGTRGSVEALVRMASPMIDLEAGALRRLERFHPLECLADLTTSVRCEFWEAHRQTLMDLNIPFLGLTGSASPLDVPYFQLQGALALSKIDRANDMQLTQAQARLDLPTWIPLAVVNAHHWDMAFRTFPAPLRAGSTNLQHPFPHGAALTATYHLLMELGLLA